MSFRHRLVLAAAAAVAVAIIVASSVIYLVVRRQLRGEVDDMLRRRAGDVLLFAERNESLIGPRGSFVQRLPDPEFGLYGTYIQLVRSDGAVIPTPSLIEPSARSLQVAAGTEGPFFEDVGVGNTSARVLTVPLRADLELALQVARPLEDVDQTLRRLRWILLGISAVGVAIAAGLGWGVARTALAPVRQLTEATERVTSTGDLSNRMTATGGDELSRLASSFNAMLEALERSLETQRQLVADASHELRTPLTSLRTNIEVLGMAHTMSDEERRKLLDDIVSQIDELTTLVGDVVDLARGTEPEFAVEEVRLDQIVESAVRTASRRYPHVEFTEELETAVLRGTPERIERAVLNLLDNAAKWSPEGGRVEIAVAGDQVVVRDHGPGIDEADLPHVFDRFYRSASARSRPGSGLGLAIVKQVAEAHDGGVVAENAAEGGARLTLRLSSADSA